MNSKYSSSLDSPQALEEYLLFITNQEDDPNLSAIDNKRRRHTRILWAMRAYFDKLGFRDKVPELRKYIADLAIALGESHQGRAYRSAICEDERVQTRPMRTWGARLQAALGLECLILSGLSREKAASDAAKSYKALASLTRGTKLDLKGSLLSWYDRYGEGRVPVPELLEAFETERSELKAANLSPAEYRRRGKQAFMHAVKTAIR